MQMNVGYFPINEQKDLSSDEDKPEPAMTEDQLEMKTVLDSKKEMVINKLLGAMSHSNKDVETALNASSLIIELIETQKTFEIIMSNEAKMVADIIALAIDPSNSFNQQYLLQVLIVICKQLKPQSPAEQNMFKSLEKDDGSDNEGSGNNQFKEDSAQGKNTLKFLKIVKE